MEQYLPKYTEFETKYRLKTDLSMQFKMLMMSSIDILGTFEFKYVEGPDVYYTKIDDIDSFARYRKAINEKKAWLTMKSKRTNTNNINRKEVNWRADGNEPDAIRAGMELLGYEYNFTIYKMCHIYEFDKYTIVMYAVIGEDNTTSYFLEIELDEENIHTLTETEALQTIRDVENVLAPLGVTYRNRLYKSLFEMYRQTKDADKLAISTNS